MGREQHAEEWEGRKWERGGVQRHLDLSGLGRRSGVKEPGLQDPPWAQVPVEPMGLWAEVEKDWPRGEGAAAFLTLREHCYFSRCTLPCPARLTS